MLPAAFAGQRLKGQVRSFRDTWGFLTSEAFQGDLFVGLKGNPHLTSLSQDQEVEFDVKVDENGKAEAISVTIAGFGGIGKLEAMPRAPSGGMVPMPGTGNGVRYTGWVRSFKETWGFINSESFQGDVFVGLKGNPQLRTGLQQDDQVEFEIKTSTGKAEAVNVRLLNEIPLTGVPPQAGPATRAQVAHLLGHQMTGRIKSFRDHWGFVNSDQFTGDLFIHTKSNAQLGTVAPGDPIQFEIAEDTTSPGGSQQAVNATCLKDDVKSLLGERLRGWVKSFKSNWGFLNSNRFDGDIFVGLKANSQLEPNGLQQGELVEFQIAKDDKATNGVHATKVRRISEAAPGGLNALAGLPALGGLTGPPIRAGGLQMANIPALLSQPIVPALPQNMAGRPRPEALIGQRARGVIRSFRGEWGFIVSEHFEGDLFLHQGSNPSSNLQAGDNVVFEIAAGGNGKCHATKVQGMPQELQDLVGQKCTGQVRSFRDTWGFVTSTKYLGDLFVGMRSNSHLLRPLLQGEQIEFVIQRSTGKTQMGFEAVQVMTADNAAAGLAGVLADPSAVQGLLAGLQRDRSRSPPPILASLAGPLTSKRPTPAPGRDPARMVGQTLDGWIRSFKGGWGFVVSDVFDGDVFIGLKTNKHLVQELGPNDPVQFQVATGPGGKLEAINVQPM